MKKLEDLNMKLPFKVKLCYAIGQFGNYTLLIFNSVFLLFFYTDIIQISSAAATVIIMIARAWDAINDPMMGIIVDKAHSSEGKCRAFLRWCSIPAGICVFLSYYVPDFLVSGKVYWVAVMYILQGMAQTVLSVPLNTLLARLSQDRVEIAKLGQYTSIGSVLANLLVPAVTLPLIKMFGGADLNMKKGMAIVAALYGIIYAISHLAVYFGTKGYEQSEEDLAEVGLISRQEKTSVGDILKALAQNKLCLMVSLAYLMYCVYSSLMGSSLVFYITYNLKNQDLMTPYSILSTVTGFAPIVFIVFLVKKFGTAGTSMATCVILVIGESVRFISGDGSIWCVYFGWAMEGIGLAMFGTMVRQCMVDAVTYGEWKTGVSNQAILMSVLTFSQKLGQAFGGVCAAALLTAVGYIPNAAEQSEAVKNTFFAEQVTLPLIIFVINFFIFAIVRKYEKKIPQMKIEIAARNKGQTMEVIK